MKRTAHRLRRFHAWHLFVWIIPGGIASWLLRDSVAWVSFLSWYAICITSLTTWQSARAETAIEEEREELEEYFHRNEEDE